MTDNEGRKSSMDGSAGDYFLGEEEETPLAGGPPPPDGARRRILTNHKKTLDRISVDGQRSMRHSVPDYSQLSSDASNENRYFSKRLDSYRATMAQRTCDDWMGSLVPAYKWLKVYKWKSLFVKDLIAGATVGVMIIPQSMSYAKLAGLNVEFGLYSALVPVFAYAFFGTSRQLAVGPVALISLLLSNGLTIILERAGTTPENTPNYDAIYSTLAIQTSFLVGTTYIVMGLLRLGFVTIFLSHAVISGFTTGAAVIIGLSQVKYILGYDTGKSKVVHEVLINIFKDIEKFNYKTFLMGTCSIIALVVMKNIGKTYPKLKIVRALGPLTVTVVTIILVVAFDLNNKGIPIVDFIPKGLPSLTISDWTPISNFTELFVIVISIAIVGFMESIAIAKQLASKHKYEIDSSQELMGLGVANFAGAMFNSYPITGSFSRSAVNHESGAVSGISSIITATMVGFTLLLLTPIFEKLPLNVLAAIVISGVLGLLDYEEAMYLWRVHKFDFFVWVVACAGTLFLGVEPGLGIAVGVSLLLVTYESAYPHTAVLGRLPGTTVYRNVKQYPKAERYDGIVMVRIDAPIYFANTQNVREKIRKYERQAEQELRERQRENNEEEGGVASSIFGGNSISNIKYIILELSPVSHVDTSALHILQDMIKTYRNMGVQFCFSNPSVAVMRRFVSSGLADEVGRDHIFVTIDDALHWCLQQMDTVEVSQHEASTNDDDPGLDNDDNGDNIMAASNDEPETRIDAGDQSKVPDPTEQA